VRLRRLSFRGLVRFTSGEPISIDFDALGPGLIALVGENGAGKSTTVEAVPAALYKALPSRGGWYEYFHGRDAFAEASFEDQAGRSIRALVKVDAETRKTEPYLFVDGDSVTTGRAKEFDAEILRRFGSYELFLAGVLGAQKRTGNFLDAAKGDRKARFIELLGLAHLQELHERARDRRARAEGDLGTAWQALKAAEAAIADKGAAEASVLTTAVAQEGAAGALETAREEEAAATAALERARTAEERLAALRAAKDAATRSLTEADLALKDAIASGTRARQEAARRREANETQGRDVEAQEKRANDRHAAGVKALGERRGRLEATLAERAVMEAAGARVKELEAELVALEDADITQVAAENKQRLADGALAAADRRVRDAENRLVDEQARLAEEAKLLDQVPCTSSPSWEPRLPSGRQAGVDRDLAGTCPLLKAAQDAKARGPQLTVDPALVVAVRAAQAAFDAAVEAASAATLACDPVRMTEIRSDLPALRDKAARAATLAQAAADLKGLAGELERVNEERSHELKAAAGRRDRLAAEVSAIEEDLRKALADAIGRETTARARVEDARERSLKAERAYQEAAADDVTVPQADAGLSKARQDRLAAERALREADKAHAMAVAALDVLRRQEEAIAPAREAVASAEQGVGAWKLLEQALGRDGIQALEIDAAGPEVARLTNELLRACYGSRWTISFETLREKKSSPGEYSEAFDIRVFDEGRERSVEGISGGERVFIGEAIALGLAIFNARKSGIAWRTLFRDETSGALSLANASAYVEMLRRALTLGGFYQCVFVSHQPEVVDRADARLVVADGRVTIEGIRRPAPAEAVA
jgi:exonuclease SbcC